VRIEVDELWSFIGKKREPWWVWTALDSRTRQVVGMAVGERDEFTARCLWESLPPEYRQRTIVATDLLHVYQAIIPPDGHATGGKEMGLTAHVERFFGTRRQRCARVVRKSCRSRGRWRTMSAPSGTSSDTTTYAAHRATTYSPVWTRGA
jgi:insertion element IS1 protein InsB